MNYTQRLSQVRRLLVTNNLDGLVVSQRENIAYLSGLQQIHPINREALLLVTQQQALLYHSAFLSPVPVAGLTYQPMDPAHLPVTIYPQIFNQASHLGIEAANYTVAEFNKLHTILPKHVIIPTDNLIGHIRLVKDSDEVKLIAKSCRILTKLMSWAQSTLIPGVTETDFAHQIEIKAYELGADGLAFPSIVAFGAHGMSPHHVASTSKLDSGPVLLDLGVMYQGYASDMTRTFWVGASPLPRFLEIETVVRRAYQAALNLVLAHFPQSRVLTGSRKSSPGSIAGTLTAAGLDHAARSVIESAGFGKYFIHTTGHGLGLEIHEPPSLNSQNVQVLVPGMVITIEPGIYLPRRQAGLPDKFGYRHENTILLA